MCFFVDGVSLYRRKTLLYQGAIKQIDSNFISIKGHRFFYGDMDKAEDEGFTKIGYGCLN